MLTPPGHAGAEMREHRTHGRKLSYIPSHMQAFLIHTRTHRGLSFLDRGSVRARYTINDTRQLGSITHMIIDFTAVLARLSTNRGRQS